MASISGFPDKNGDSASDVFRYLIVRPDRGGFWDLLSYSLWGDIDSGVKFLESSDDQGAVLAGGEAADFRWAILFSIVARKIIHFFAKPMKLTGYGIEFFLNLLSQNGSIFGLLFNLLKGDVVIPKKGTKTFISIAGYVDPRMDLYQGKMLVEDLHDCASGEGIRDVEFDNRAMMDLCMMASKVAYENPTVVRNAVVNHWKMHFVGFYDCWDDYQNENSTQVFLLCDKPVDANLILICFRGTEFFDADDWCTDFDYSWYEIPNIGKLHMGFLEALGLGNREDPASFHYHLQKSTKHSFSEAAEVKSSNADPQSEASAGIGKKGIPVEMVEKTAYYIVRQKLKALFEVHKNAKYVITGHSLGGALGILFTTVLILHEETELLQKLLGVYTFGQPRVGNRQLGRFVEAHFNDPVPEYFRVVYCNDLVPRLPSDNKTFLYKHFGVCLYYNRSYIEQRTDEEPNKNYFGITNIIPQHLNAVWELVRSLAMGYTYGPEYKEGWICIFFRVLGLLIPGVSAHLATNYVNSVRLGKSCGIRMSSY